MRIIATPVNWSGMTGAAATVHWEDRNRAPDQLYAVTFDSAKPLADSSANHWAILAAFHAAIRHGEKRLRIDGPIDGVLYRGLLIVQKILGAWFGDSLINLEMPNRVSAAISFDRGSSQMFSGGIDSFATLIRNHEDFGVNHSFRVARAIHIDWQGPTRLDTLMGPSAWQMAELRRLTPPLAQLGVELLPVVTNSRSIEGNEFYLDWMFRAHGAQLGAVAHAMAANSSRTFVASTYDIKNLAPWGSHPLVDPNYSSLEMSVLHDSPDLSRFDKVELLAEQTGVWEALSVCSMWFERQTAIVPNCGRCEKCLRTLTAAAAAGIDVATLPTFETYDIEPALSQIVQFQDTYERACWEELVSPLRRTGKIALAREVELLLERCGR